GVAADRARSAGGRRPRAASSHMTDLRAAMRRAVSDSAEPGAAELYHVLAEALLDSAAEEEGPAGLERVKSRVYRLRIGSNRRARAAARVPALLRRPRSAVFGGECARRDRRPRGPGPADAGTGRAVPPPAHPAVPAPRRAARARAHAGNARRARDAAAWGPVDHEHLRRDDE